ncbi:MAG TPA: biopolymer transporter ExbD [Aquificae bacterium]|nr:biopolymer transporter ExbD [Aquificota bacterium]
MPKFQFEDTCEKDPELILIPLIDVMLFLLAFFVLILGAVIPGLQIKTNLPQSISKGNETSKNIPLKIIVVTLKDNGEIWVGNKKAKTFQELKNLILKASKKGFNYLVINADKNVPIQYIITVMDLAKESGITKIGILTRGKDARKNK